jgi:hypothetical protein
MFLCLYDKVTNVLCVSLLSRYKYQYDSLILSKQTWAYPGQHLQQLLWCQGHWRGADITKECLETNFHLSSILLRKLCVHYPNSFDNIESVYFFYSNPVYCDCISKKFPYSVLNGTVGRLGNKWQMLQGTQNNKALSKLDIIQNSVSCPSPNPQEITEISMSTSQLVPEWSLHYDFISTRYLLIFSPNVISGHDLYGRQESTDQACPSAVD